MQSFHSHFGEVRLGAVDCYTMGNPPFTTGEESFSDASLVNYK